MIFTDDTIMSFGEHGGKKLANVPASYLLWLKGEWDAGRFVNTETNRALRSYIEENLDVLKMEIRRNK
jgi:uncharacterized protein (DUF3820 family)